MSIDDVALRHVIDAPQGVHDFVPRRQAPRICREQAQQALLNAREVQLRRPDRHMTVENVDL